MLAQRRPMFVCNWCIDLKLSLISLPHSHASAVILYRFVLSNAGQASSKPTKVRVNMLQNILQSEAEVLNSLQHLMTFLAGIQKTLAEWANTTADSPSKARTLAFHNPDWGLLSGAAAHVLWGMSILGTVSQKPDCYSFNKPAGF